MTVEAYLRSLVMGLEFTAPVLERCARSPKEVGLERLLLEGDIDLLGEIPADTDEGSGESEAPVDEGEILTPEQEFQRRLDYASSTLYYSVIGIFTGGGYSEKVGDVQVSQNNFQITQADRERYKMLADALRRKWGFDVEEIDIESTGMFDASELRRRPKTPRIWRR